MTDEEAPSALLPPAQQTLDFPAGKGSMPCPALLGHGGMGCNASDPKGAFKADIEQLVGIIAGLFLVRSEVSAFL